MLRYSPSGQQRRKGLEPTLSLCTQGQREGARPHPRVHSRSWGRSEDLESPAPRPGLPEHSPIQVPIAWLSAQSPVGMVGHPPLLAAAVCLSPEEARLVDYVVFLHHSSPVAL